MPQTNESPAHDPASNSAAHTDPSSIKTRRSHKKSRNGCKECKQRHIRCDETRPVCANCKVAARVCDFPPPKTGKQKQKNKKGKDSKEQHRRQAPSKSSLAFHLSNRNNDDNVKGSKSSMQPESSDPHRKDHERDVGQSSDKQSRYLLRKHYFLPALASSGDNPPGDPSPASPTQLTEVPVLAVDRCPGLLLTAHSPPEIFTSQHMILLHHASAVPNYTGPDRRVVDIALRYIIEAPYLIDEVLAFTAFHMTSVYPGSAEALHRLAVELQTRALASFNHLTSAIPDNDKVTAVPRYLFSAILGRHMLADSLAYCRSDFHFFIDRFTDGINLNRGIRAVCPPAWDYLYRTEMRPFLRVTRDAEQKIVTPGNECDPLRHLMNDSDLSEASVEACQSTIDILQWSFDICKHLDEAEFSQAAAAFCVRIGDDFVSVLRKHRPEALIILAYYGILLSQCRNFPAFGSAGEPLIRAIAAQLGSYWQDALAWPLSVLGTDRGR